MLNALTYKYSEALNSLLHDSLCVYVLLEGKLQYCFFRIT